MTIRLKSGLVLRDAETMLKAKFTDYPWDKYDGYYPTYQNRITAEAVDRALQLGMRGAARPAYQNLLNNNGGAINRLLTYLPYSEVERTNLGLIRDHVIKLFDLACSEKGVKLAGSTKLLYLYRRGLLSVIDNIVADYYWYATSINCESRFRQLQDAWRKAQKEGKWGEYVFALLALLKEDVVAAKEGIDEVRCACAGEPYSDAPRVRVVESLIWYYYARGGSTGSGLSGRSGDRVTK